MRTCTPNITDIVLNFSYCEFFPMDLHTVLSFNRLTKLSNLAHIYILIAKTLLENWLVKSVYNIDARYCCIFFDISQNLYFYFQNTNIHWILFFILIELYCCLYIYFFCFPMSHVNWKNCFPHLNFSHFFLLLKSCLLNQWKIKFYLGCFVVGIVYY